MNQKRRTVLVIVLVLIVVMGLFTNFFLAAVLFGFDSFWRWFFDFLDIFPAKQPAEAAMAGLGSDWRALSSVIPTLHAFLLSGRA